MLTAIVGGLIGVFLYQMVKAGVSSAKPKPKPISSKKEYLIPIEQKCACGHKNFQHREDGLGECGVLVKQTAGKNYGCACQRFTFPVE